MKRFLGTILLFICSQSYGSELSLLDASLFQYAASNTNLPDQISRELWVKTTSLCTETIKKLGCSDIFAHIAPQLGLLADASPQLVAQALAEVIFKNPSQTQVLYTLTQLTLASSQIPIHENINTKADLVIHTVRAGVDPLIKTPVSKIPMAWIYIGSGVTISAMLIIGVWYFIIKQRQTTTLLTHNQEALLEHVENLEALMERSIQKSNTCEQEIAILNTEFEEMATDMETLDQKIDESDETTATMIRQNRNAIERTQALATLNHRLLVESCKQTQEQFQLTQNVLTDIYRQKPASKTIVEFNNGMDEAADLEFAANQAMEKLDREFPATGKARPNIGHKRR